MSYRKIHVIVHIKEPLRLAKFCFNLLILYTVESKLDLDRGAQMCVVLFISLFTLCFRNK